MTHLVDLVQWECFPDQIIDTNHIQIHRSLRWPTKMSLNQFNTITKSNGFPDYLKSLSLIHIYPRILGSKIGDHEFKFIVSADHHRNWLESIRDNKNPIAPVEEAHRSCSACLLHHIAMKLDRKIKWNPDKEEFVNDPQASAMLSRPQRKPFNI